LQRAQILVGRLDEHALPERQRLRRRREAHVAQALAGSPAQLAWERTLAFLSEELGPPAAS